MATVHLNQPSNSDKNKNEQERRLRERRIMESRPVSTTDVAKKKDPGIVESILRDFIKEDIVTTKQDVVENVIKPGLAQMAYDCVVGFTGRMLGIYHGGSTNRTDYRGRSVNANANGNRSNTVNSNRADDSSHSRRFDSRDYAFPNRGKAEEVLSVLRGDIDEFGKATVATFLKEAGATPVWTDTDIGWTSLDGDTATVRGSLDGYVVVLPYPKSVKNL